MQNLRGHNSIIKEFVFSKNDSNLYSYDEEGVIFEWNMFSSTKRKWESKYILNSFCVTRNK